MYLPGLKNSVADALNRQPDEAGYSNGEDIGDSGSGPYALKDPIVFISIENCLQMLAPFSPLTCCIKAIKTALSSSHAVFALACNQCSMQHLNNGKYTHWRHTIYLYAGCSHKWDAAP